MNNTASGLAEDQKSSANSPGPKHKPLITKRQAAITTAAAELEKRSVQSQPKALVPWFMAILSMPYKDPGNVPAWERVNGDYSIQIVPDVVDGVARYPYGSIPRLLMIWMSTQAQITDSPVLDVASSLDAFVKEIGLSSGGKQRAAVMDQMNRLFGAGVRLKSNTEQEREGKPVRRLQGKNFFLVDSSDVLFTRADTDGQQPLWGSTITLSASFFEQIKGQSFPVLTQALKTFKTSPLQTDIYLFLVYRLFSVKAPVRITWQQLNSQFGAQYERDRAFKAAFIKNLAEVAKFYPEANYKVTQDHLILYRSKQHIPSKPIKEALEEN